VHDPAVCAIGDAVLQEDSWSIGLVLLLDPIHVEDVAVGSVDWVRLKDGSVGFDYLLEVPFKIRLWLARDRVVLLVEEVREPAGSVGLHIVD